jgi:hypothetical protein
MAAQQAFIATQIPAGHCGRIDRRHGLRRRATTSGFGERTQAPRPEKSMVHPAHLQVLQKAPPKYLWMAAALRA